MVLIISTKNESNLTNRYWDMNPDGRTDGMDGRTDGRSQNYIPQTSSGDNKLLFHLEMEGWGGMWVYFSP